MANRLKFYLIGAKNLLSHMCPGSPAHCSNLQYIMGDCVNNIDIQFQLSPVSGPDCHTTQCVHKQGEHSCCQGHGCLCQEVGT